jgi:hypothetical protein
MLYFLLTLSALAGPLDDGFRGHPWGDPTWLVEARGSCHTVADGRICADKIGEVPVDIHYTVGLGLSGGKTAPTWPGIIISAEGFTHCSSLHKTLQAAYGRGQKFIDDDSRVLPEWLWNDGDSLGSFSYNQLTDECEVVLMNTTEFSKVMAAKEVKAAENVIDL